MEKKQFYVQLFFVSALCAGLLVGSYYIDSLAPYIDLGVIGLIFFIILSVVIFRLSNSLAKSKNLNAFTHLILYNLMIKLFLSFVIVITYYYLYKPENRLFIVPYIVVYLIFTIFEAVFLSSQARLK
jgi:Na+/H+-dicarboxylate symporter